MLELVVDRSGFFNGWCQYLENRLTNVQFWSWFQAWDLSIPAVWEAYTLSALMVVILATTVSTGKALLHPVYSAQQ